MRERLPDTRKSVTHKLVLRHVKGDNKVERIHFYLTVGCYADGRPAELFITVNKGNDTIAGFCKCWAIAISLCLQAGIPLAKLVEKFQFQDFEPRGFTESEDIRNCKSIVDYVIRWMGSVFSKK